MIRLALGTEKPKMPRGVLFMVATPIGNLGDLSPRAARILGQADVLAAEDTRVSRKLISYLKIHKSLLSYHEHNQQERGGEILDRLKAGQSVALLTDAGAPCVSDPGEDLARRAHEAGIEVVAIPGPSAVVAALMVSGLPASPFYFHGFLSREAPLREAEIKGFKGMAATLVMFESPHRVGEALGDLARLLGDRRVAVCRELTKIHEQVVTGRLGEVQKRLEGVRPRGEYTLVVEGAPENIEKMPQEEGAMSVEEHLRFLISKGKSLNQAIADVARLRRISRREIYQIGHGLAEKGPEKI